MTIQEYMKYEPKAIKFAKWQYAKRSLSTSQAEVDGHDVVTDLYFEPDEAWDKLQGKARQIAIMNRIRSRIKDKAKALWTKQGRIAVSGLSIDEAPSGDYSDDGEEEGIESTLLSDSGKSAAEVCRIDENYPEPPFVYLVRAEVENLGPIRKRLAKAVMAFRFREDARRNLKLCKSTFWKLLKSLRPTFVACLTARNLYFSSYRA